MRWITTSERPLRARLVLAAGLVGVLAMALLTLSPTRADAFSEQRYVVRVLDGDTIEVAPAGQTSGTVSVVRLAGVQTNETWMCHGGTATNRLRNLIEGKWVNLSADTQSSKTTDGRWLRYVDYANIDIGELMIEEGYALAFPTAKESARNEKYMTAAFHAAERGDRIWNPSACGNGPQQSLPLRVEVRWDAVGGEDTPNGEWATIYNDGSTALSLNGWQFRDAAAAGIFPFPSNASIAAGSTYRVYPGPGTNTSTRMYLNLNRQYFEASGDGGYLLDPHDDIRAYYVYPCTVDCADWLQGRIRLTANYDAEGVDATNPNGEWVNIDNISGSTVDLKGYELRSGGQIYYFPPDSKIFAGERMRVYAGSGTNSRLAKYWGHADGALANAGDLVEIVTLDLRPIAAFGWPCNPCGPVADVAIVDFQFNIPGPDAPNDEWIDIRNHGNTSVDLRDWMVKDSSHFYDFKDSRMLAPGSSVRLYIGSGNDNASSVYWGQPEAILGTNEILKLESPHRDLVSCRAQGTYQCQPVAVAAVCQGLTATIVGTDGPDTIVGTIGDDIIAGAGGADVIHGLGGNDRICGDGGADTLFGGAGNDRLYGGTSRDVLAGGPGNDLMYGNSNVDTVSYAAAAGPVTVDLGLDTATGEGTDTVTGIENAVGSRYADTLIGGGAPNRLDGGDGNDTIMGKHGNDVVIGGDGNDTLRGGKLNDKIYGGFGADTIHGGGGNDIIKAGNGNDVLNGNAGDDSLYGGFGSDSNNGGTGLDLCSSGSRIACEL